MAILLKSSASVALTVLAIAFALFSGVGRGSACAKNLGRTEKFNKNAQTRRLEVVTDSALDFVPEASLYGIIPEPWNEQYGFIPWQRPYMDYNSEEHSRYVVTHNWDYGTN